MKIISTNIAQPKTVSWKNREVTTGIYKDPVNEPVFLDSTDVKKDHVMDRHVHGGIYKACYFYSADYYDYWKNKYPRLNWQYGMFGENITVEGLDEKTIHIGDIYKVGEAVIQVTQPRQPCFKLGIKFNDPGVLKAFIKFKHPGFYVKVLEPGFVQNGNILKMVTIKTDAISVSELFILLTQKEKDFSLLNKIAGDKNIPQNVRDDLMLSD